MPIHWDEQLICMSSYPSRHLVGVVLTAGLLAGFGARSTCAQETPRRGGEESSADATAEPLVSAGVDLLFTSAFVWRGFVDIDSPVVQPDAWVRVGGLTVSSWLNVDPSEASQRLTEHDLTVDYSVTRGLYTLSVGWINYAFLDEDTGRHSDEVYVGVARDGPLSPAFRVYRDFRLGTGTYASLGVAHTLALARGLELTPAVTVGYNHRLYVDASAFSDAVFSVKGDVPTPVERLVLQPFVAYSLALDDRVARSRFLWGVGASFSTR